MRLNLGLVVAAISFGVGARAQTTTDCTTYYGSVHCQTSASSQSTGVNIDFSPLTRTTDYTGDAMRAYEQGQRIAAERQAARDAQERANVEAAQSAAAWHESQRAVADRAAAAQALADAQRLDTKRQLAIVEADVAAKAAEARDEATFRRTLGGLIEAGHCDEARKAALEAGRMDDAASVNLACTSASRARR